MVGVVLVSPHEISHNQTLGIEGMTMQDNSWRSSRRLLRVAASSNPSFQGTLGVSVMEPQLRNQQVITFNAVHHSMLICYAA